MDELIALPVRGEAFVLKRRNRTILVDGGHSGASLAKALEAPALNLKRIDVVVCTHADADHAKGLTSLLDHTSLKIGEFWLPGAWVESLDAVITAPGQVAAALVREFIQFAEDRRGALDGDPDDVEQQVYSMVLEGRTRQNAERAWALVERDDQQEERRERQVGDDERRDEPEWVASLRARAKLGEFDSAHARRAFTRARHRVRYQSRKHPSWRQLARFWVDLIDTAERIREIAMAAFLRDVCIRWFDFGAFARSGLVSGGEPFLLPLNSVELSPLPAQYDLSFSYLARLTPINEECLVFWSPAQYGDELGVVFTGDSPLGNPPTYSTSFLTPIGRIHDVIATAPHHGSESNANAYRHLNDWARVWLWVRTGGSGKKHPGFTYRQLPEQIRACTHCPRMSFDLQPARVQLGVFKPWWWGAFRVSSHSCSCV